MGDNSKIEWTDASWNPVAGCSLVSAGCTHCYAMREVHRLGGNHGKAGDKYRSLTTVGANGAPVWNGKVRLWPEHLDQPLRWKRPRRIFVNSMSDLFHEGLPDEAIDQVFAVMALAPQHTFQVLTKRPGRMLAYLRDRATRTIAIVEAMTWFVGKGAPWAGKGLTKHLANEDVLLPISNVWLGVSVEDQATAEKRILWLLDTPAAVRWVSYEPALGPVDFENLTIIEPRPPYGPGVWLDALRGHVKGPDDMLDAKLDWLVCGGESGPGARPFNVAWARSVLAQCRAAGVPFFMKQLGAKPFSGDEGAGPAYDFHSGRNRHWRMDDRQPHGLHVYEIRDRKGGDPAEWPEDLRVQDYPEVARA